MHKISYLIFAFFLFIIDQLSKWSITEYMIRPAKEGADSSLGLIEWYLSSPARLGFTSIEILPFFNIVMVWNRGVSFGMFNNLSEYGPWILSGLSLAISAVFLVWLFRSSSRLQSLAIALVISGAIGNVVDRVRFGAVIDFLDFHAFGYHWPAFNVADSAICIGVFLLIIQSFFFETDEKNAKTDSLSEIK